MPNTLFTGKVLLCFDELPSTNDYARAWLGANAPTATAKSRPPEGTVVRAVSQSAGRGQFGSQWRSEPGANLTFSLILYPLWLAVPRQFALSQAVALAVRDTVAGFMPEPEKVRIKWPNDIYIGDQKTGGILIENVLNGGKYAAAIVGIGLNVNQQLFPPDLPAAVSMSMASGGRQFALETVLDTMLEQLERRYLWVRAGHLAETGEAYLQELYRLGETAQFERPDGSVFSGAIRGVSDAGQLLVETSAGLEAFAVRALRFL